MEKKSISAILKKNAMLIVLVLVYLFFLILTKGGIFKPSSFTELINQNAYVYILGAGMLMCMLTGGNIDLSCGAFVCLLGALGGVFMIVQGLGTGVSILLLLAIGVVYGVVLGYLIAYVHIPPWIATLAGFLSFRGLGTSILSANSKTGSLAPFPVSFQNLFYGRVFPSEKGVFNWPCFIFGLLLAALVVLVITTIMCAVLQLDKEGVSILGAIDAGAVVLKKRALARLGCNYQGGLGGRKKIICCNNLLGGQCALRQQHGGNCLTSGTVIHKAGVGN